MVNGEGGGRNQPRPPRTSWTSKLPDESGRRTRLDARLLQMAPSPKALISETSGVRNPSQE